MIIVYNLREIAEKCNIDKIFNGNVLFDVCMAQRTTFKIGGNAPVLFEPADVDSLCYVLTLLKQNQVPFFLLGGGSNIVVSDSGFKGAVIATCLLNNVEIITDKLSSTDNKIFVKAGAGATMQSLVNFCTKNCITGIEPFAGLPGSVGGASFMNARCFNLSVSDVLTSAEYLEENLSDNSSMTNNFYCKKHYSFDQKDWDYKKSFFTQENKIVTSVTFCLTKSSQTALPEIQKKCAEFVKERIEKGHFKFPCAGSVFKNNHTFGAPSGKIIDELGLKGLTVGGAQVAPWHGNIIINNNHATQKDVLELTEKIKEKVFAEKGFKLETEIIFCGN